MTFVKQVNNSTGQHGPRDQKTRYLNGVCKTGERQHRARHQKTRYPNDVCKTVNNSIERQHRARHQKTRYLNGICKTGQQYKQAGCMTTFSLGPGRAGPPPDHSTHHLGQNLTDPDK